MRGAVAHAGFQVDADVHAGWHTGATPSAAKVAYFESLACVPVAPAATGVASVTHQVPTGAASLAPAAAASVAAPPVVQTQALGEIPSAPASPTAAPGRAPITWLQCFDYNGSETRTYFHNTSTGVTQWCAPSAPTTMWRQFWHDDGWGVVRTYFYNTATKQCQWNCPTEQYVAQPPPDQASLGITTYDW